MVKAERDADFRRAYARADLCLPDGKPLVWASVSWTHAPAGEGLGLGSRCAVDAAGRETRVEVYLLGGAPGVAEEVSKKLTHALGVRIAGTDSPMVGPNGVGDDSQRTLERLRAAHADLVLVAFGAPAGTLDRSFRRSNCAGCGDRNRREPDFLTGRVRRAPAWMSRAGLEWLFRLGQEPRRLWRRYLVEDPAFIVIVARSRRAARTRASL